MAISELKINIEPYWKSSEEWFKEWERINSTELKDYSVTYTPMRTHSIPDYTEYESAYIKQVSAYQALVNKSIATKRRMIFQIFENVDYLNNSILDNWKKSLLGLNSVRIPTFSDLDTAKEYYYNLTEDEINENKIYAYLDTGYIIIPEIPKYDVIYLDFLVDLVCQAEF